MKMNIVFWNSDVHSKISYLLIWYWVKQFLFEWRHKWTLHFEHFQYVFPEHCSFLHLVLFTADTNIGQWSNPSYLKSFGTLDADSRVFFRGGSFSSSLRLSLEIELVEYNISSSELSLSISFDIFGLFNKYDEREIEVSVLFIARRYLLFVLLHHMIYICLVFSFLSHMLGIFFLSYTWDFSFLSLCIISFHMHKKRSVRIIRWMFPKDMWSVISYIKKIRTVMTECPLHGTFPSWFHNVSVGQLEYCGILSFDNLIICLAISFERTRFFPAFMEKQ